MDWNYERKEEKEEELLGVVEACLQQVGLSEDCIKTTAQELLECSIKITPPEKVRPVMNLVTMAPSGRGGGRSSKAGNITLNIRALFEAASSGVFTVISVTQTPWAIPFAAVLLWNSIWKNMQVDLSESEAVTLWVMWQIKDSNKNVKLHDIKSAADTHAAKYQRATLSEADIKHSVQNLKNIGCIKPSKTEKNTWWLCEWISPSYR